MSALSDGYASCLYTNVQYVSDDENMFYCIVRVKQLFGGNVIKHQILYVRL